MWADAESSCIESRTDSRSPDGARNPWSAPTTELWAPTGAKSPPSTASRRASRPACGQEPTSRHQAHENAPRPRHLDGHAPARPYRRSLNGIYGGRLHIIGKFVPPALSGRPGHSSRAPLYLLPVLRSKAEVSCLDPGVIIEGHVVALIGKPQEDLGGAMPLGSELLAHLPVLFGEFAILSPSFPN